MVRFMVKRTKKEFKDYNTYRDRPFGLKWGTAFAMDELVKGIVDNELEALKDNKELVQMDREEVDAILSESFLYFKTVIIQLNLKDEYGRYLDNLEGQFLGEAYEDYFVLEDSKIYWEDVRHIEIKQDSKWFNFDMFEGKMEFKDAAKKKIEEIEYVKDEEFIQEFYEDEEFDG